MKRPLRFHGLRDIPDIHLRRWLKNYAQHFGVGRAFRRMGLIYGELTWRRQNGVRV